ncbi:hypothetical protein CLOBOL_04922 [Enterocloster bolteae ATCC BAA-613]|uniref:Uncharacterized protein n=1 Tax=Enterocloster bolteae (strain ATCC BAA-613 / DSM 15670 / CCUG 46953 / JCM 12243 / WAL 16351) TaxID=411902 RepID=A8RXQ7_ENTBW|nr:hypothetical protein CLOBOL_04922 [Enterocloster bolteae ATCC BAA-613]
MDVIICSFIFHVFYSLLYLVVCIIHVISCNSKQEEPSCSSC